MKNFLTIAILSLLVGCSVVPVKRTFPAVPPELLQECPDLKQTPQTEKLSEVVGIVVDNYGQYHECRIKENAWIEWYNSQKQIFDSVK